MEKRTPLRERISKIIKHYPIVYRIDGINEHSLTLKIEDFENKLECGEKWRGLLKNMGVVSYINEADIKEQIEMRLEEMNEEELEVSEENDDE